MGETFASTNPVTGTPSMSVLIGTSPGRAGFGPRLSFSLALLAVFFICAPKRFGQSSPFPRDLKQGAITTLRQISTTDKDLREAVTRATNTISQSLSDDKNTSLFLDEVRDFSDSGTKSRYLAVIEVVRTQSLIVPVQSLEAVESSTRERSS